jgi:hypothetical protein
VAVFGMDMVRGFSGLVESEVFCKLGESDLNNFCCMLRTLVAMMKGKKSGVRVQPHAQHAFIHSFLLHPSPFSLRFDDVVCLLRRTDRYRARPEPSTQMHQYAIKSHELS